MSEHAIREYLKTLKAGGGEKTTVSVRVNSTTTGEAGTQASVVNVGDEVDVALDFIIPRGAQGVQGETGPQGPQGDVGEQGPQGVKGDTGDAAGFGNVTATVDSNTGTPSVSVTPSGPDTAKNFSFEFHNLKGEKGDAGDAGDYSSLANKPQINSVTLLGNKTFADLGLLDFCHPVWSTYQTLDANFNPNVSWGGTWTKLPEGYILLSGSESGSYQVDTGQSTPSGYKEYGANEKSITVSNMPSHAHAVNESDSKYFLTIDKSPDNAVSRRTIKNGTGSNLQYNLYSENAITRTGSTGSRGSGSAFNVMQKSIAVYTWIRTA